MREHGFVVSAYYVARAVDIRTSPLVLDTVIAAQLDRTVRFLREMQFSIHNWTEDRREGAKGWAMSGAWMETATWVVAEPARVAVMIGLAQADRPLDDISLAQVAGMLYQRITGNVLETALLVKHITDLAHHGLLQRDDTGFRWQMTPLGTLVSRQWAPGAVEPPGNHALETSEVRAWRDRLIEQLEDDEDYADEAGISREELLAGQGARLAELRVLNRVLGEENLPAWLREMVGGGETVD